LTTDEILSMGEFCEDLMRNDFFAELVNQFDKKCFENFTHTKPPNTKEREALYFEWNGVREFIHVHMKWFIDEKNRLTGAPSQEDAPFEDD
jgi:hypothetical protein